MAKKARSKKESTTKKSASIAGVKKSGDKLPQSCFAKNHELYLITRIDTDLLVKEIQTHYRSYGNVRAKPNKANDGDLTVQVFRNKQTKIPVIEIPQNRWVQELVVPELAHFFGPGKVVKINDLTEYIDAHEFLYERELDVLKFDSTTAMACFSHLVKVSSEASSWWGSCWLNFIQFRLLIYRLLRLVKTELLLAYIKRPGQSESLTLGISQAILHIYMVGAGGGNYSEDRFYDYTQEIFDNMFKEYSLDLQLTKPQRIDALEAILENGINGITEVDKNYEASFQTKIKKALSAIRK